MAGIGFSLRRLYLSDSILGRALSLGHGAAITAGPWLFTIISLGVISILMEQVAGFETLAMFRVTVIYAFAISLIASAPVVIVSTRLVADALYARRFAQIGSVFLGALGIGSFATAILVAWLYFIEIRLPLELALPASACCCIVSLIWIALAFSGTVRDYRGITLAFLTGLLLAVIAASFGAIRGYAAPGMLWGFTSGLSLTFVCLTSRVLETFPQPVHRPLRAFGDILRSIARFRLLALGASVGAVGIWIDKYILWNSEIGEEVAGGLVHAPLYDSAMFIAYLVIIPSLASFVSNLEVKFFENYHGYYSTILRQGTLRKIEEVRSRLAHETLGSLHYTFVVQFALTVIVVLIAPAIVELLNLQYRQIPILRMGAMGAAFQFVFLACSSVLLFFDRTKIYLTLQALFMLLNGCLTLLFLKVGPEYYGLGYLLACAISGVIAFKAMERTLNQLNFLTFIGNNPSIRQL